MGLFGLKLPKRNRITDAIGDVFDANSQADQQRRMSRGQPRFYDAQQAQASGFRGVPYQKPQQQSRSIFSRTFDQINPLDNNRTFKQSNPTDSRSILNQTRRNANTTMASVARSTVGAAQDLSGAYDLLTPGTGTNRFTKNMVQKGADIDKFVKDRGYSTGLYRTAQVPHQAGMFWALGKVGAAPFQAAGKIPVVAKAGQPIINAGSKLTQLADDGSKVAKVANYLGNPQRVINVGVDAIQNAGNRTSKGQDNSPTTAAIDVGMSVATQGALDGSSKVIKKYVAEPIKETLKNKNLIKPNNLNDAELAALAEFRQTLGNNMDEGIYLRGVRAANKAGIDYRNPEEIDDLLGKQITFDTRKQQRGQKVQDIKDRLKVKALDERGSVGRNIREEDVPNKKIVNPKEIEIDNTPAYLRRQPKTIEEARIQRERGINNDLGKKLKSQTQLDYETNLAKEKAKTSPVAQLQEKGAVYDNPLDVPTFQRKADLSKIDEELASIDKAIASVPDQNPQMYKFAQKKALAGKQDSASRKLYERRIKEYGDLGALKKRRQELATQRDELLGKKKLYSEAQGELPTITKIERPLVTTKAIEPDTPTTDLPRVTKTVDEAIYGGKKPTANTREDLSIGQELSPDRAIRENITRPIEEATNKVVGKMQRSQNPVARNIGTGIRGFFGEAGRTSEDLAARRALHAGRGTGELKGSDIREISSELDDTAKAEVWAALDPDQAGKLDKTVDPANFTPEQTAVYTHYRDIQDAITAENLKRGNIKEGQAANKDYFKRGYSIFDENSDHSQVYEATMNGYLNQFKGREKNVAQEILDTQITDPGELLSRKMAESEAFWAMQDYGDYMVKQGYVSDVAQKGFTQLPNSKLYGSAAGKYVPTNMAEDFMGFQYSYGIARAYNDLVTKYDNWGVRKAKKEILTIFNPAVRLGNRISNQVVFSNMNGINPITFNKAFYEVNDMIKNKDPLYREAVEMGLTGTDILQADVTKNMSQYIDDPNVASKVHQWIKKSYSGADDKARIAAYKVHRERGYSPQEAANMVQRGFQDYKSVGFFYDLSAKTPLIGNAFVRFVADAMRIAKNTAVDHPMRAAGTIAMWSAFANGMSVLSGESELQGDNNFEKGANLVTGASKSEAQKTREGRFGTPKIPFTDISLAVQTPIGEVNVARFLPYYQLNDIQEGLTRYAPIQQSPVRRDETGKLVFNGAGFGDPLLGQAVQLAVDEDFRQRKISDPEQTGQFQSDLPTEEKTKNRARFLATNNLPLGREIDNIVSAATGNPDMYGKERSLPQALLRAGGVKVEQFGPEQVKKQEGKNQYFEEKAKIDAEVQKLPKADQEAYKRLTGYYKLREKTTNEFNPSTQRYVKDAVYNFPEDKWKEYQGKPELYDMLLWKKNQQSSKPDGPPLQPEFDNKLSLEFRKQLISNKSLPPGEDVEADARMYSSSEWDTYQQLKKEYTDKASKYYPKSGDDEFKDEMVKHESADFPEKPSAYKAYSDAYTAYSKGQGPKPTFNDEIAAAKDSYSEEKRLWTNKERMARNLPPISKEMWDNVTFGYESDEEKVYKQLKYGKGYGGFGGYGGGSGDGSFATAKYLSSISPQTSSVKPKATAKAPVKIATKAKASSAKPKVSIKKSKV